MTHDEALAFWFGRVNFEKRVPRPDDLKLDRMLALLRRLGDPHQRRGIVHVTGSKGKGSTAAVCAAILREAGFSTGLFTSPHLSDVRERIQVDGEPIRPEELTAALAAVRPHVQALDEAGQPATFFEISTAVGFLHFARRQVQAVVLEVGLGGRFDSTNVCAPEIALITSVSLDHVAQLGSTVEQIAFEKAGIIKPGVPILSGVTAPGPAEVIARVARERGAPLWRLGREITLAHEPGRVSAQGVVTPGTVRVRTPQRDWPPLPLALLGAFQADNAALAIAACGLLPSRGFPIADDAIARGLKGVRWPGRLEVVPGQPLTVLDCAHNLASVEVLVAALGDLFPPVRRTLLFAASADKDVAGMLATLAPHFDQFVFTRYGDNPRAVPPERLAELLPGDRPRATFDRAAAALAHARDLTPPDALLVITGSVFLVGELRPSLLARAPTSA